MFRFSKTALILGVAAALSGLPTAAAAQKDPDAAGVAEAIRYEKAKQAAADRQARIEERGGEKSADAPAGRKTKSRTVKTAAASQKTEPAPPGSR